MQLTFRPDQIRRYSRHILLPDVGGLGQSRLLAATVAVDVSSAAARVAAAYLAASGVSLVLHGPATPITDAVFPFTRADLGQPLLAALVARLAALNPDVLIEAGEPGLSDCRTGDTRLVLEDHGGGLAEAMARGGEAAARIVHALAVRP